MGSGPEGDTIFRTAAVLRAALLGRRITAARAQPQPGSATACRTSRGWSARPSPSVEARGKHLLIGFDDGPHAAHPPAHAGLMASIPPGRAMAPARCAERQRHPRDGRIGGGRLRHAGRRAADRRRTAPVTGADDARARPAAPAPSTPMRHCAGFASVMARRSATRCSISVPWRGSGTWYKSEVAFLEGLDPWAPVAAFDDEELLDALRTARRLLQANTRRRRPRHHRQPGPGPGPLGLRAGRPALPSLRTPITGRAPG